MFAMLYDRLTAPFEHLLLGARRRKLVGELRGEVIEVGAGTGATFEYYPPDLHVLALEPDPAMLDQAQRKLKNTVARVDLRLGGDEELDSLAAASVDAVIFFLVLCTIDDPARALRRARRVLRPNGALLIIEHVRSPGLIGTLQDFFTPLWSRVAGGCRLNRETTTTLTKAGFDLQGLTTLRLPIPFPIRDLVLGTAYVAPPSRAPVDEGSLPYGRQKAASA